MKVSASVLLLSALGVTARPSGHVRFHDKRDFVVANKPVTTTVVQYVTQAAVQAAAATTTAKAAASTTAAAASSSTDSSTYVEFCSGSSSKRATAEQIAYTGNTGTTYGCNIMVVGNSIASQYNYTAAFTNSVAKDQHCVCWNKIGPTGLINGFFSPNKAISFTLPASSTKTVAFQANSQGGCACSVGSSLELTTLGEYSSTWFEFDFGNTSNNGWSGADASCLVAKSTGTLCQGSNYATDNTDTKTCDTPALKVCNADGSTCSTINTGGESGSNAYFHGMEDADGVGLNIPAGSTHLKVTVGA